MATQDEPVIIEISEEAYKQNTVYRPWTEIRAGVTAVVSHRSLPQSQTLKVLAADGDGLSLLRVVR